MYNVNDKIMLIKNSVSICNLYASPKFQMSPLNCPKIIVILKWFYLKDFYIIEKKKYK